MGLPMPRTAKSPEPGKSAADEVIASLRGDSSRPAIRDQRCRLLGRWIVQGGVVVRDVTFEDLEQNQTLREEYRFLFRRDVAELDRWVREKQYWRGPARSLDLAVVRGGNLPAAVQSIVPGGGGRGARDVAQLSDRELRVELAVSSAWVSYLRLMIDPESRRERQLPTRGGARVSDIPRAFQVVVGGNLRRAVSADARSMRTGGCFARVTGRRPRIRRLLLKGGTYA